ncbi:MAG: cobyric acid synthase [Deltaproteobacteria bacterium]|nr:cobyric acid synthase [Deltaproteobacteria bacterium]
MFSGHGGNVNRLAASAGKDKADIIDFSASINPLGPPESLRRIISRNITQLCRYPDPEATPLVQALADSLGVDRERIVAGNGSTEIIYALPRALGRKRAVIPVPSYADYAAAAQLAGLAVVTVPLAEKEGFLLDPARLAAALRGDEIVFIGQPNNPTGRTVASRELYRLIDAFPDTYWVIDESFADFIDGYESVCRYAAANLIMVRSLTKFYAIPGLRLGCGCASPEVAALLRRQIPPWTVNTLAQEVGCAMLGDREYAHQTRDTVARLRRDLTAMLEGIKGLAVFAGEANFLLVKLTGQARSARPLADRLLREEGIAIRVCDNFAGFAEGGVCFFRVAVRNEEDNVRLAEGLQKQLHGSSRPRPRQHRPALMLQGTASNAGKSVLTAALCRILLQDGVRVAPFKAQNMSLNSYVTRDGLEMGRAQVVQAQACRLDPDARMNPVLLKPSGAAGCQVIVNGKPVGDMTVDEHIVYKKTAWQAVTTAYDSLAAEYDVVLLEGAGSPGEVNLKHHDIVNMRMAHHANSPVLLVGDIDRGGVFASFVGTMEVLAEWERGLVAGFIVNRFRGNAALLGDAFEYVHAHTDRPVLGLVPFLPNLGLPEEDSVGFKAGLYDTRTPPGRDQVEIALIDLPHISNFTDFEPFLLEPDVHLHVIRRLADLEAVKDRVAAILLPGSKNVMTDLRYLYQTGLADLVKNLAAPGKVEIIGICGGFQMLGEKISDLYGIESCGGELAGLGLLALTTVLELSKTLARRTALHGESGLAVQGYEIHHGRSISSLHPVLQGVEGERICGATDNDMVWGTYLHGIFDADPFRRWLIDRLRVRRGLAPQGRVLVAYDLEAAFDRLADTVRRGLDMQAIYRLLGL